MSSAERYGPHPFDKVIIRKQWLISSKAPKEADAEVPFVVVDYTNVQSLTAVFEEHQIDTVISCLLLVDDASSAAQINAIAAADKSSTTKRFLASNWATPSDNP